MKKKNVIEIIVACLFILLGFITLLLPQFNINNIKVVLAILFSGYTLFNLIEFYLTRTSKDVEGLFSGIISLLILIGILFINYETNYFRLAFLIFLFVSATSFVKLNKCDYYHDRKNKMWVYKVIALIIFVIIGIFTCLNLYKENRITFLGYFFFINGILELIDPLMFYLIEKNKL